MGLGEQLRARARELGLTDAEVARRAGLGARRYGHYVTGQREPDVRTLMLICKVLGTSPNYLLGFEQARRRKSGRDKLVERLIAAIEMLDEQDLRLAVAQVEAIAAHSGR